MSTRIGPGYKLDQEAESWWHPTVKAFSHYHRHFFNYSFWSWRFAIL